MSDQEQPRIGNPITAPSIIEKMMNERKLKERREAIADEERQEYITVVNRLFSSPDGVYFLNKLIRYCGVYSFDKTLNPAQDVVDAATRKVYLELIRPYLEPATKNLLDN